VGLSRLVQFSPAAVRAKHGELSSQTHRVQHGNFIEARRAADENIVFDDIFFEIATVAYSRTGEDFSAPRSLFLSVAHPFEGPIGVLAGSRAFHADLLI
jgi:hypothetical protein